MSKRPITAAELMAELQSDPEWVAQQAARDLERERSLEHHISEYDRAAKPLRDELAAIGLHVESIDDLHNRRMPYKAAIPLLIEWLPRIENPSVKESIVRSLSVRDARPAAAPAIIDQFSRIQEADRMKLGWVLGNALAVVADDSVFEQVAALAEDGRWGRAREMIVVALANMTTHRDDAIDVLRRLLDDEEVAGHAVMALGTLRAVEARADVEPFLEHPKSWIRKEAKKTLKRMG